MTVRGIKIAEKDQVITIVEKADAGACLEYTNGRECIQITAAEQIPKYHKAACEDIAKGSFVYKYGEIIGIATEDIKKGMWVHTHNLVSKCLAEQA